MKKLKNVKSLILYLFFVVLILGSVLMLLVWPPIKTSAQILRIDTAIAFNRPKVDTFKFDSLSKKINAIKKSTEKVFNAAKKLEKTDKQLTVAFKKLENYIDDKNKDVSVMQKNKPKETVKSKQTFWQKIKSIFKSKNKKNGKSNR